MKFIKVSSSFGVTAIGVSGSKSLMDFIDDVIARGGVPFAEVISEEAI